MDKIYRTKPKKKKIHFGLAVVFLICAIFIILFSSNQILVKGDADRAVLIILIIGSFIGAAWCFFVAMNTSSEFIKISNSELVVKGIFGATTIPLSMISAVTTEKKTVRGTSWLVIRVSYADEAIQQMKSIVINIINYNETEDLVKSLLAISPVVSDKKVEA